MKIDFDNDWIIKHKPSCDNWVKLCAEYNSAHNTNINYSTFKYHINHRLGYRNNYHNPYSDEQIEWLKTNYPILGRVKCTEQFNAKFNMNKTVGALKKYCQERLGLRVSEERKKLRAIENTHTVVYDIGTIVKGCNGHPYIKTEDGWKRLANVVYGEIPKGHFLVHLDGDENNCNKENLYPITRAISGLMLANEFWSENPEITKTGIICCDLQNNLKATCNS